MLQINIRVDEGTAKALDDLAAEEEKTRAEVLREALMWRLADAQRSRIDRAYENAYTRHPETPEELRRAEEAAIRLTGDEPWIPWW